jgi:hypothetical protein
MGDSILYTLSSLTYYLVLFLIFVVAVLAFVRFRATPSGLMIGGGLLVMAFMSSCFAIIRRVGLLEDADLTVYTIQSAAQSCAAAVLWAVIAAGVFMIPKSLESLGKSG